MRRSFSREDTLASMNGNRSRNESKNTKYSCRFYSCLLLFAFLSLVFVFIDSFIFKIISNSSKVDEYTNLVASTEGIVANDPAIEHIQLHEYCNDEPRIGTEGRLQLPKEEVGGWTLHHLLVNIRHGDRSAIHSIPNAESLVEQVDTDDPSLPPTDFDHRVHEFVPALQRFSIKPITASGTLPDSLNVEKIFRRSDHRLKPGQLTSKGFMQHIMLGRGFYKAYTKFLGTIQHRDAVSVRSTNYDRTIQSVAAFLIGLLPHIGNSVLTQY